MKYQIYFEDLSEEKQDLIFRDVMRVLARDLGPDERQDEDQLSQMADDHINRHNHGNVWDIWVPTD